MATSHVQIPTPLRVPAWVWVLSAFALIALFVMSQENGALLGATAGQYLHEFTHDARHTLGFPCH
ncbi:CbtB-domain containing protein [Nocardioides sp. W3-2-3]|nr:CbtB-domain containing protein [Nocardioides convexus]